MRSRSKLFSRGYARDVGSRCILAVAEESGPSWIRTRDRRIMRGPGTPLSLEDARRLVEGYVEHYNNVRLNSAIGYITPKDLLAAHQQEIQAERDRKLEAAREQRKTRRQRAA